MRGINRSILLLCLFLTNALVAHADVPQNYPFTAVLENWNNGGLSGSSLANFTAAGVIPGTVQALDDTYLEVAVDPSTGTNYALSGELSILNPADGTASPIAGPAFSGYGDSHINCLTFDTLRDRVVVSSYESQGYMFSWSPATQQWTLFQPDLGGVDIDALSYFPANDSFYAIAVSIGGGPQILLQYNSSGELLRTITLSEPIPESIYNFPGGYYGYQLVTTGDRLALIIPPDDSIPPPAVAGPSICWLIDPTNGDVTYTGTLAMPEPALALMSSGIFVMNIPVRRRKR